MDFARDGWEQVLEIAGIAQAEEGVGKEERIFQVRQRGADGSVPTARG
jgi:hypothetical protein